MREPTRNPRDDIRAHLEKPRCPVCGAPLQPRRQLCRTCQAWWEYQTAKARRRARHGWSLDR
jgi:hypothetical protein